MAKNSVREIFVFQIDDTCGCIDHFNVRLSYDDLINILVKYKRKPIRMEFHDFRDNKKTYFKTKDEDVVDESGERITFVKLSDGTIAFPQDIS